MAAKRGKSQARRSGGNDSSIPGWAWLVLGVLLAVVVMIVAPKYLKSGGDGFLRVQPNPDAQPAPVSEDEDAVAPEGDIAAPPKATAKHTGKKGPEYDFYTLLPGKEVPVSDEELAATARAEAQREAAQQKAQAATAKTPPSDDAGKSTATANPLPRPVDSGNDTAPATPAAPQTPKASSIVSSTAKPATAATASTTAASKDVAPVLDDNTRYLLQAGAFQASGQAEEMKAKIAMLGLGARVESALIDGKTVYRVRMGPYGTASDLADAKRKLSAGGLSAMAIKVK